MVKGHQYERIIICGIKKRMSNLKNTQNENKHDCRARKKTLRTTGNREQQQKAKTTKHAVI